MWKWESRGDLRYTLYCKEAAASPPALCVGILVWLSRILNLFYLQHLSQFCLSEVNMLPHENLPLQQLLGVATGRRLGPLTS
jgi:hypothetical protein